MNNKSIIKWLLLALVLVSLLLVGCQPDDNGDDGNKTLAEKYQHISIVEARLIAVTAGSTPTAEEYTIIGTIVTVSNATNGEMTVADEKNDLYICGSVASDGTAYDGMTDKPVEGDVVVLKGVLMSINGTPQMGEQNQKAVIVDWEHVEAEDNDENPPSNDNGDDGNKTLAEKYQHISILEALTYARAAGDTPTTEQYTIVGTIVTVSNATYGEMTVADDTGEIYVYGSMASDGTYYDSMTDRPVKGDVVVLKGVLMSYNGTPQMGSKNQKAIIVDWEHVKVDVDVNDYPSRSVAEARDVQSGDKVRVDGVVSAITYANGHKPSGVILIDETASIYVYSGDIAQQVSVGNKIEIVGIKTYWILDTEQKHAEAFGYRGACQIEEAVLVSNDKGSHDFDTSWIEDTTVKQLLNTNFEENVTSLVFKSTALIKKAQGTGFVNYYVNDLDGTTGSYVYTQCNGSDFSWMDKYDGKICEVYYTVLNAKSSASGCVWRLLPVAINEIANFSYPAADVPSFAIEYGVVDLFGKGTFGSDPALQLPNTYSNEIIGATNVTFTYSVDDATVGQLTVGEESTLLNLIGEGSCEVTITATAGSHTATAKVVVQLNPYADIQTPTVAEIIAQEDGATVQLRGIVISSLVNQTGFYIGDATGMIAVRVDSDTIAQIKPGDEVVIQGTKKHVKKDPASTVYVGQCAIDDATLLANYYGEHDYDTSYFITDKTIDDLYVLDINTDYTNNVYVLQAKVVVEGNQYYSNILLQDENGENKLRLYCSSSKQYSWLTAYEGQVVTIEIAVCNWNGKDYYTGCVISVTVDGEKIINTLNFAN